MLTDRYQRRFRYLRLSITESCNFKCDYCLPDGPDCSSRREEITLPEIKRLVTAFAQAGTEKVRITGGEPALRRDLTEIIAACKATPGIKEVAITTNGYRLERDIEAWKDAGLDAVNVSVDSFNPGTFQLITGDSRLPSILKGIDKAIALGMKRVKINAVLLRGYNFAEYQQFLDYVKDHPVSLRFIELMLTGDNREYYKHHHVSGSIVQRKLEQAGWESTVKGKTAGPALEYQHPDYAGKMGLIMPYSKDFCNDCNRLRVSSRGQLFMCLFASQHQDLRHLLQEDAPEPVIQFLQDTLQGKEASHHLHEEFTGSTRHLAMIGG
ncbi:GTP 3',8-cyclase MoaA [Aliidiomarina halalkaliphila]|uniref:GTP 3',8-cyclase n=1 Tax=Aliidiomarina halalkaliphila TaxID=2593535 RepID=A0A552X4U7_9GAMM|nr:GTP 3',8-cyclase MoaA [Aliidiomarina halalkaliphila]TRW49623.1 GTP 3',8-cyclase MoaA [Aliidiomarina halalkaliphila]